MYFFINEERDVVLNLVFLGQARFLKKEKTFAFCFNFENENLSFEVYHLDDFVSWLPEKKTFCGAFEVRQTRIEKSYGCNNKTSEEKAKASTQTLFSQTPKKTCWTIN